MYYETCRAAIEGQNHASIWSKNFVLISSKVEKLLNTFNIIQEKEVILLNNCHTLLIIPERR